MDSTSAKMLPAWTPYFVGGLFVALFTSLCVWQVSRGFEKREYQHLFATDADYTSWNEGMKVYPFQRLEAVGRFDGEHQFLLENIVRNARNGYFVVTPLILGEHEPALLVNRGWIEKQSRLPDADSLSVDDAPLTVRGRAGSLPRAGFKMGAGILPGQDWPRLAVFPDVDEVSSALGRDVQPVVLLMAPEEKYGFLRDWQPSEFGPGRHFAYAFQWFVMATVLAGLLIRNYRRRTFAQ